MGAAGQTSTMGQTATLKHQTTLQTTAIAYDQPSNQTIYNVQSSSGALASSQTNLANTAHQVNNDQSDTPVLLSSSPLKIAEQPNVDQQFIHLDVDSSWPAVGKKSPTDDEHKPSTQPFKATISVRNDSKLSANSLGPENTCPTESNGQRNCINV